MQKPPDFGQIMAEARDRCAMQAAATGLTGRELVVFCARTIAKLFGDAWPQIAEWLIEESYSGSRLALKETLPKDDMERWSDVLAEFAEVVAEQVRRRRRN